LDNTRFRVINRLSPGPYVFILKTLPGTEKILDIRRNEAGVRIPDYPVPVCLINTLGSTLYSITAKKSMTSGNEWASFNGIESSHEESQKLDSELPPVPEEELFESGWELEDIDGVDLILDGGEERERVFSTILDMCTDEIKLIRKGAGPWPV
jgi:tRNA A37 threonylcarbamoyladenosine synthetase subunit TsaC/SUA5/YrdC